MCSPNSQQDMWPSLQFQHCIYQLGSLIWPSGFKRLSLLREITNPPSLKLVWLLVSYSSVQCTCCIYDMMTLWPLTYARSWYVVLHVYNKSINYESYQFISYGMFWNKTTRWPWPLTQNIYHLWPCMFSSRQGCTINTLFSTHWPRDQIWTRQMKRTNNCSSHSWHK